MWFFQINVLILFKLFAIYFFQNYFLVALLASYIQKVIAVVKMVTLAKFCRKDTMQYCKTNGMKKNLHHTCQRCI